MASASPDIKDIVKKYATPGNRRWTLIHELKHQAKVLEKAEADVLTQTGTRRENSKAMLVERKAHVEVLRAELERIEADARARWAEEARSDTVQSGSEKPERESSDEFGSDLSELPVTDEERGWQQNDRRQVPKQISKVVTEKKKRAKQQNGKDVEKSGGLKRSRRLAKKQPESDPAEIPVGNTGNDEEGSEREEQPEASNPLAECEGTSQSVGALPSEESEPAGMKDVGDGSNPHSKNSTSLVSPTSSRSRSDVVPSTTNSESENPISAPTVPISAPTDPISAPTDPSPSENKTPPASSKSHGSICGASSQDENTEPTAKVAEEPRETHNVVTSTASQNEDPAPIAPSLSDASTAITSSLSVNPVQTSKVAQMPADTATLGSKDNADDLVQDSASKSQGALRQPQTREGSTFGNAGEDAGKPKTKVKKDNNSSKKRRRGHSTTGEGGETSNVSKKKRVSKTQKQDESEGDESEEENEEVERGKQKVWRMEEKTAEAVEKYLNDPRPANRLATKHRTHIREAAKNCPGAGKACWDLSRDILVTKTSLLKCVYHQTIDKSCRKWDESQQGEMTGTPYAPTDPTQTASLSPSEQEIRAAGGVVYAKQRRRFAPSGAEICDCGCLLEDAIWGLWLWKSGKISYEGRSEGYDGPPTPRTRGFAITLMKEIGIKLDDLWTHELEGGRYRERSERELLQKRAMAIGRMLLDRGGAASLVGLEDMLSFDDLLKVES
ncbi:hypothetical protein AAF712_002823 [Marasmius tenuissimus]|uniref:Uncharacterized protein n=1 Tax=Marasmius tenuissimus TaxID=585030 RepID=A0ABR3A8B1_9AGAR